MDFITVVYKRNNKKNWNKIYSRAFATTYQLPLSDTWSNLLGAQSLKDKINNGGPSIDPCGTS